MIAFRDVTQDIFQIQARIIRGNRKCVQVLAVPDRFFPGVFSTGHFEDMAPVGGDVTGDSVQTVVWKGQLPFAFFMADAVRVALNQDGVKLIIFYDMFCRTDHHGCLQNSSVFWKFDVQSSQEGTLLVNDRVFLRKMTRPELNKPSALSGPRR